MTFDMSPPAVATRLAAGKLRAAAVWVVDPDVKAELRRLADTIERRPSHHVIEFSETGWVLQHPIVACGLDLFTCPVNQACDGRVDGPPEGGPGRYRIDLDPLGHLALGARMPEQTGAEENRPR